MVLCYYLSEKKNSDLTITIFNDTKKESKWRPLGVFV